MIVTVYAQWWSSKFYWRTKFPFRFSTASLYLNGCSQCEQRQPEIHLFAARFREQSGDIPGARAAYQLVHDEISPGLLEAIIKHANMEHRLVSWLSSSLDSRSYLEIAILNWFFPIESAGESGRCLFFIWTGNWNRERKRTFTNIITVVCSVLSISVLGTSSFINFHLTNCYHCSAKCCATMCQCSKSWSFNWGLAFVTLASEFFNMLVFKLN